MGVFRKLSLLSKMTLVIAGVLLLFFFLAGYLDFQHEHDRIVRTAKEKARILAEENIRIREYLSNQYLAADVRLSEEGIGLIPLVASERISRQVARGISYELREVFQGHRNPENAPDDLELSVLRKFQKDAAPKEYFVSTRLDGKDVFRYIRPFVAQESCLECYGNPEDPPEFLRDLYPMAKDKVQLGEIVGAISIIIPMEDMHKILFFHLKRNLVQRSMVFVALVFSLFLLSRRAITRPLGGLVEAMNNIISTGSFSHKLVTRKKDEIGRLIETFNSMVDHLREKSADLEESERRFRILTETARDAIVSFLSNGQIILFNRRAEKIFGYRKKNVIGVPIDRLIHEDNIEIHQKGMENYLREKAHAALSQLHQIVGKRRDGSPVSLELSLSMAESDGHIFYTAILRELTVED